MHPYLRVLVLAVVAIIVAGALVALGLAGRNTILSLVSLLAAGMLATVTGGFVFAMSWVWAQREWNEHGGRSLAIAMTGGLAIIVGAAALAGTIILLFTFGLG